MSVRFPWVSRLPQSWILNIATLGPIGHLKRAPGTWGSIAGLFGYTIFFYPLPALTYLILLAALIYVAAGIAEEAERLLGIKDPGSIIIDEFVAIPVCFMGLEGAMHKYPMWLVLLAGLALFRFFDILKPVGISYLQRFQGGWGIVVDDLAAAFATCVALHLGLLLF